MYRYDVKQHQTETFGGDNQPCVGIKNLFSPILYRPAVTVAKSFLKEKIDYRWIALLLFTWNKIPYQVLEQTTEDF